MGSFIFLYCFVSANKEYILFAPSAIYFIGLAKNPLPNRILGYTKLCNNASLVDNAGSFIVFLTYPNVLSYASFDANKYNPLYPISSVNLLKYANPMPPNAPTFSIGADFDFVRLFNISKSKYDLTTLEGA